MKCSKCGKDFEGKFCPECGTPAEQTTPAENTVDGYEQQNNYADPQPNGTSYGQQFTNQPNGQYAGQQFTNQPVNYPNGKQPMSGGKIAAIIVSIVVGLILIFGIIFGVVACHVIDKGVDIADDVVSRFYDDYKSGYYDDYDFDYDEYFILDEESGCYYRVDDNEIVITDYEFPDNADKSRIDIKIPSQIEGMNVVEIENFNTYSDSGYDYIKVTIPGSVREIDEDAFSYFEDLDEVVIEDGAGVKEIDEDAFIGCSELKKITVPASVNDMDKCGLGISSANDEYSNYTVIKDAVIYGTKGSTAEQYAEKYGITFKEKN